jgi:DNA mismatch endonuclease (patch repair protein)
MGSVRQRNTGPEVVIRKALHRLGFRYRLNDKKLPGSPDIVLSKYRTVVFVHGCFWHRHGCNKTTTPSTRKKFWEAKFNANINRDAQNIKSLKKNGWRVMVVWECEISKNLEVTLKRVVSKLCRDKAHVKK